MSLFNHSCMFAFVKIEKKQILIISDNINNINSIIQGSFEVSQIFLKSNRFFFFNTDKVLR